MTDGQLSPNLIINDTRSAQTWRKLHYGWGWCAWCGYPSATRPANHTTYYKTGMGMFPLCDICWDTLDIEDKLFAYRVRLLDTEAMDKWPAVKAALLKELAEVS